VPWYLLINETEPKWRLHDTMDVVDLKKSLTRVMDNGAPSTRWPPAMRARRSKA